MNQKFLFMDNKINAWLEDILRSIDEIADFLPEKKDFFEFQKDLNPANEKSG